MEHWNNTDPLKRFIGNDSVTVLSEGHEADGSVTAVLQGERFEKQIHTTMPDGTAAAIRQYPVMPPVKVQYPEFLKACTACGKCIEACPEHIIKPAQKEYEVYGIKDAAGKPTLSFELGFCRTNCQRCAEACPTHIIPLLDLTEKRSARIGWAQFNSRTCLTQTEHITCDACSRHCPQKAIITFEKEGQLIPRIVPRLCNGCGACEFYCPARPKAIYIEGL